MNLLNVSLKLNNFPIEKAKSHLEEIQRLDDGQFYNYIQEQKQSIVRHHLENNSFYKKLAGGNATCDNWNSLPVLTKSDLQIPLKERLSDGFSLKNVYLNKTSGSTGNPFYFAKDKFTHALTWAIIENRFNQFELYGEKQARFYGEPKEILAKSKERLKYFLSNRIKFNVFDLSDNAFESWIAKFSSSKYVYMNGYTTVINAFANYLHAKGIVLKDICSTLKACVVTSEMCFEEDKIVMEKAFGVPVINEYGASELDIIAFQNKNNQWLLTTESLFIEVLDAANQPLPDGEVGKLVITSLYNKAHPFIRYEIGDVGSITQLDSRNVILGKLEGRNEDLVYLPSGKVTPGLTFYYITKSVMKDSSNVKEIKVVQKSIDTFDINYVAEFELNDNERLTIKNALENYLEPNLNILFHRFEQLERSKSGKLKQFTSLIKSKL